MMTSVTYLNDLIRIPTAKAVVLIKNQASLDLNPGSVAMIYISKSCPHRSQLLLQSNQVTKLHSLSSIPCPTTKTFSLTGLPSSLLSYPPHHILHSSAELSLPYVYDPSVCCIPLSRIPADSSSPSEKVFANTLAPQDLGYGGDISVSRRYDTLSGRLHDLNTESPLTHLIISPPNHSPTGKPVELCPSGY